MTTFSIDTFAQSCKAAMAASDDRQAAARDLLLEAITTHGREAIIEALEAAIPAGASIGEMVVFADADLTMMYARAPGRFQSAVHNHTVWACIGQLSGQEISVIYECGADGLVEVERRTAVPGRVVCLDTDAIHRIENPDTSVGSSLHLYGGDLPGLAPVRSLWNGEALDEHDFSFPALVQESARLMHRSGNRQGLEALAEAIPAARPLVDSLV